MIRTHPRSLQSGFFGGLQRDRIAVAAIIIGNYRFIIIEPNAADKCINDLPPIFLVVNISAPKPLQEVYNLFPAKGWMDDFLFLNVFLQISLLCLQFQQPVLCCRRSNPLLNGCHYILKAFLNVP